MSAEQQKFTFKLPAGYDPDDFDKIADDVVEIIRARTAEGMGVRKRGGGFLARSKLYDFPDYTPQYEKFKGQTKVDLRLTNEMLDALSVLEIDKEEGTITIGYDEGDPINGKVEGNVTGSYGKPKPNPKKARNFLGVTNDELEAILAIYPKGGENG